MYPALDRFISEIARGEVRWCWRFGRHGKTGSAREPERPSLEGKYEGFLRMMPREQQGL